MKNKFAIRQNLNYHAEEVPRKSSIQIRRWIIVAKYMIEFNPPVDVKNNFEKSPDLQKKMGEAIQRMKPLTAWFTLRYGFFVVEANSNEELTKKVAPFLYLFKTDVKISPAFDLDEFPKIVATLGEEAKKYGY
jgi:hypothetical protein